MLLTFPSGTYELESMSDIGGATDDGGIAAESDPLALFANWMADAKKSELNDPDAMSLATVDAAGRPNVRMVLLKDWDADGFVFYSNKEAAKGSEIFSHPHAALCLHWKSLRRQVRVRGRISEVSAEEADAYFASRARDSQIGAWASAQSRPMDGRFHFEEEIARYAAKFASAKVPRPDYWTGFRIAPFEIEFWSDRPFRLHDRLVYRRDDPKSPWVLQRLFP
jgi:pyridoxamine 5'-phosphate oxidase